MKRIIARLLLTIAVLGTAMMHGQATRTWVSGVGDDGNPCSRTAPCKTFAGALAKTAAGGEIDALDPGGFGAVAIPRRLRLTAEAARWRPIWLLASTQSPFRPGQTTWWNCE